MEQITKIIEMGSGAVVSLLLIGTLYFVMVRFTGALDEVRKAIVTMGARHEEACDLNSAVLVALQQQVMVHDLTVSGLNPAAGATVTERDSRAYAKYVEVQRGLEEVRAKLAARHS